MTCVLMFEHMYVRAREYVVTELYVINVQRKYRSILADAVWEHWSNTRTNMHTLMTQSSTQLKSINSLLEEAKSCLEEAP